MSQILGITLPIFATVALGYISVWKGLFTREHMRGFGLFVMNFALPALLFSAVARRDVSALFDLPYMTAYLLAALLTMALSFTALALLKASPSRRAVAVMGTACPNTGFVGYPLFLLTFPEAAGQLLALNMLVENLVIIPLCLVLFELSKPVGEAHIARRLSHIFLSVLKRPMVIALLLGLVASLCRVPLPHALLRTTDIFAAAASALALFSIGGALYGIPLKGHRALATLTAAGKLILHPLMALAALAVLGSFAPLSPEMRAALILSAALPMFSIYALFAAELEHEAMASLAQIIATAGSFFTLSVLMLWLL